MLQKMNVYPDFPPNLKEYQKLELFFENQNYFLDCVQRISPKNNKETLEF